MNFTDTLQTPNLTQKLKSVQAIMLHHTGPNPPGTNPYQFFRDDCFMNPNEIVSVHYLVGKEGECAKLANDLDRTNHCGYGRELTLTSGFTIPNNIRNHKDYGLCSGLGNDYCIGIEIVNEGDNKDPFTEAQYDTLDNLIAYLRGIHGNVPIIDHKMYDRGNINKKSQGKHDMEANFDLDTYIKWGRKKIIVPLVPICGL